MKIEQSPLEGSKITLHIEATPEEYEDAVKKGVQAYLLSKGAESPEAAALEDILEEATDDTESTVKMRVDLAANYLVPHALQEAKIVPVSTPEFGDPDVPGQGENLIIDAVVMPKPVFELSDYGPVTVEIAAPGVTEEEIDRQVDRIIEQIAAANPEGETTEPAPTAATIDDGWVTEHIPDPNCTTVAQLRDRLREAGNAYKASGFDEEKNNAATAEMAKRLVGEIPEDIVEAMRTAMIEDLIERSEAAGQTIDTMLAERGMTLDDLQGDADRQARVILREGFTLDAVFRQAGLALDDADMQAALHAIAPGNESDAEEQLRASGYMFTVEETAQRLKAGKHILDHATITVKQQPSE